MNYYETEKVNDNLTMIRSLTGSCCIWWKGGRCCFDRYLPGCGGISKRWSAA